MNHGRKTTVAVSNLMILINSCKIHANVTLNHPFISAVILVHEPVV